MKRKALITWTSAVLFGIAGPALAVDIPLTIVGNEALGRIELPGGIAADLSIKFEAVTGLTPSSLHVTATLISPLDILLHGRLGGLLEPGGFPVRLRIEPTATSTLTFHGVVYVSLYTENLVLLPSVPLSLFSAKGGGTFRDITTLESMGSYRVGGSDGGFSEFVIVVETHSIDSVISGKFDALQTLLDNNASSIPASVLTDLQSRLNEARASWLSGATVTAIGQVAGFETVVHDHSGGPEIPDVWRANDSLVNVAGLLRGKANTLKFSLNRKASALL
jgi:hypothetical protein